MNILMLTSLMRLQGIAQSPQLRDLTSDQNGLQRLEKPLEELDIIVLIGLVPSLIMISGRNSIEDVEKDILLMVILLLVIIISS